MQPRYNHSAVQYGSKMVIFGGMNKNMTLEMSVQTFELDNTIIDTRVKRERQEEEKKKA